MKKILLIVPSVLSLFTSAEAHTTGHTENFVQTAQHVFSQPDHLSGVLAALAIFACIGYKLFRTTAK